MLSWIYREGGGVVSMDTIGKSGGRCSPGYMEGRRRGSFHGYRKEEGGYSPGYREGGRRDSFSNSIKVKWIKDIRFESLQRENNDGK